MSAKKACAACARAGIMGWPTCSQHCPEAKKASGHVGGQVCDSCGTYFRGDSMG